MTPAGFNTPHNRSLIWSLYLLHKSVLRSCLNEVMFQTPVRLAATTPAPLAPVCHARWAPSSQSGARPAAGHVPPTPPLTPWPAPPPPSASTRPVSTTPAPAWPSSSPPTTRALSPPPPTATGGCPLARGCQCSSSSPPSPCHLTALTP